MFGIHFAEPFVALQGIFAAVKVFGALGKLGVGVGVFHMFAAADFIKRRLSDIHISSFDEPAHITIKERQQKGTDMGAVHIGIGHDDDFVITGAFHVEIIADSGSESRDHGF